jgi:microtubule-associated protein-like 6
MEIEDPDDLEIIDSEGEEDVEVSSQEDPDAVEESTHMTFDKHKGEPVEMEQVFSSEGGGEVEGGGEMELFQEEEAVGDAFMAVKPWIGAIAEPTEHPDENPDPPDEEYKLEYVFGYRAEDSRNNLYYNADGNVVYMTACLGVILNKEDNTQTFFGGNEVENAAKQHATDKNNHTNDITSIAVSSDRTLACSGQNGSKPTVFVWDATTGDKVARFVLPKGSREVSAIGFSNDAKYVATVDNHNDHHVRVYDVEGGDCIFEQKSGNNKVFDLEWSKKEGHYEFSTCGTKHYMVCRPLEGLLKKGVYGGKGKLTSHSCVTYDENGTCYSGGANAKIHCWRNRSLKKAYKVHDSGFVGAIKVFDGKVFSGGKDGNVIISDPNSGEAERVIEVGRLIRAIDYQDGNILVGDRDGNITEYNEDDEATNLMKSHDDGETWGLDLTNDGRIITTGDDNKVMVWSLDDRTHLAQATVSEVNKKPKAGKAGSLTKYSPSKCARAVAVNNGAGAEVRLILRFFTGFMKIRGKFAHA